MPKMSSKKNTASHKWRKYQKSKQSRHTLTLGILILVVLATLILTGKLLNFVRSLNNPDSKSTFFDKAYHWDGASTINLVAKSDNIYILSFNPLEKSVTIVQIPDETYLDLPLGFGRWPTRSIYNLGQGENPPIGAALLEGTITSVFGIPVDGYLISPQTAKISFEEVIGNLRKNPLAGFSFVRKYKTNLDALEMTKLWWGIRGVRSDKIKVLDLGQSQITDWILLSDGSRALGINQLKLDQYIQDQLKDSKVDGEGLSIGIFNATNYPGLAEKAGRIVTNMGGRVTFTTNMKVHLDKSLVLGNNSYTVNRLAQIFAPQCQSPKGLAGIFKKSSTCVLNNSNVDFTRANINIILGEDYFIRYNNR